MYFIEGFWKVRIGRVTVYDWSLEEALASMARIKGWSKLFRRG